MKIIQNTKLFIVIAIIFLSKSVSAQNSRLAIEKAPAWITPTTIDYNNRHLEQDAEEGYLYVGYEMQVSVAEHSRYYKYAIKILSDAGVQSSSEVSINFDPAYEKIVFHSIHIIREGQTINKLQLSKFKTIQQEKELDKHIYDGSLTALLELDDVRKGDIIESSYTIKGVNPIFNDKYTNTFEMNFGVPVASIYYKLIVPDKRKIMVKNTNINITPAISKIQNATVYEWKEQDINSIHVESRLPEWYNPYAIIRVSEYNNWNEVSTWANALYPRNIKLSPDLQKKINEIKQSNPADEGRTLAALHFVQDNVRYMGIEMGENSHRPNNPNRIFSQRFGDCKDKSYLLVTMLNAMNITANPVLINTTARQRLKEFVPSGDCFDHCTVQVLLKDKTYWFDPTISFQSGTIGRIPYPNYKFGLVITATDTALTPIPFHDTGMSDIEELFSVPDLLGSAHLKVRSRFTGSVADGVRSDFNNTSLYELKSKYKDFYAHFFDKIVADSLIYDNDDITGTFTTTEYYTLNDIWQIKEGKKKLELSSFVINSVMTKPADKSRKMPFSLEYPAHYKEHIELTMPEDWPVTGFNDQVEVPGFKFSAYAGSAGNVVSLNYEYENLKDNVMPEEAPDFFTKFKEADDATNYELTFNINETSSSNNLSEKPSSPSSDSDIFPKLYGLLGLIVIVTFIVKKSKKL